MSAAPTLCLHPSHARAASRVLLMLGVAALLLGLLGWLPAPPGAAGLANYLPLHMALETVAIIIAALVFAVGWLNPSRTLPANITLLGCCFLGVALLDFTHTLSYQGMPDFITPSAPEKAINFWLAARLLAAIGMLAAASMAWKPRPSLGAKRMLTGVGAYVVLAHMVILFRPEWLPRTFLPGSGLTPFKIGAEYVLVLLFATAAGLLLWRMRKPCPFDAPALLGAAGLMALSELFFTLYADVTDIYNLAGHVYKIGAYYLLYQGLVVDAIRQPQVVLEREQALNRLQQLSDSVPGVLFECRVSADGTPHFSYVSQRIEALYGCRATDVINNPDALVTYVHPADAASLKTKIADACQQGDAWSASLRVLHPVRGERLIRSDTRFHTLPGGDKVWFGYMHDETEAHENQERLRLAAKVFEASQDGILVTDAQHHIVDVNPAMEAQSGYSKAELLGRTPRVFSSGRQSADFYAQMHASLQRQQRWQGEIWNRRKTGEVQVSKVSISAVIDEAGEIEHYVAVYADISALMAQRDHFSSLAHFDALTGLPNRRLLDDRLHQALAAAQRNNTPLAVCMLDLDGFKPVNDTFGHAEGDLLLIELTRRMQRVMRTDETLARLGGDEFVLVLIDGDFYQALERLLEVIREPVCMTDGSLARVTASIGVSCYRPGVADSAQLLREADEALYQVKEAGKDAWGMGVAGPQEK